MADITGDGSSVPESVCREPARRILYETVLHAFEQENPIQEDFKRARKKGKDALVCPVCGASGADTELGIKRQTGKVVCRPQAVLTGRHPQYTDPTEPEVARGDEPTTRLASGYVLAGPNERSIMRVNAKQRREANYPFTLKPDTRGMKREVVNALLTARPPFVLHVFDRTTPGPIPVSEDGYVAIGNGLPIRGTLIQGVDRELMTGWDEMIGDLDWSDVETLLDWRDGFRSSIDQATIDRINQKPGRWSTIRRIVRNTPEHVFLKHLRTTREEQE